MDEKVLGIAIKNRIAELGMPIEHVARDAGVAKQVVYNVMAGKGNLTSLMKIANCLGIVECGDELRIVVPFA